MAHLAGRVIHDSSASSPRPLAATLAAIFAVSATASVTASSTPHVPANVVVSNCEDSGSGSLRDAVSNAVSGDTIDMTGLTCSTITLTTGTIAIGQSSLAFSGPGRNLLTVDAATSHAPVLYHLNTGTLLVENMTVSDGYKYNSSGDSLGGCIHSDGDIVLVDVDVENCMAYATSTHSALGGALWAQGSIYLGNSTVTASSAIAYGTGVGDGYASGGGVYAYSGFRSVYSLVAGNYAQSRGLSFGGGVFARGSSGIYESAIVGNSAGRMGGVALADRSGGIANVFNSTITANYAFLMGGLYVRQPLYLYNSTIAFNRAATFTYTGTDNFGVGVQMGGGALTIQSTIVSSNSSKAIGGFDLNGALGTTVSGSHNLIASSALPVPPDTLSGPVNLLPVQDNGGITPTCALLPGADGIDQGSMPPAGSFLFDQRGPGFARQVDGSVDIGAFESDPDRIFTNGFNFGLQNMTAGHRSPAG